MNPSIHRSLGCTLVALAAIAVLPARAGAPAPGVDPTIERSGRHDNTVYAGINWTFGVRNGATAVVGYRVAKVSSSGHVDGLKAEIGYVLSGAPMGLGEAKLKYLNGSRYAQAEFGGGYSFASRTPLLGIGVQGPYVAASGDYLFGQGSLLSVGVNTLGHVRHPKETLTCPTGTALQSDGTCD